MLRTGAIKLSKFPPDYLSIVNDLRTLKSSPDITNQIKQFFNSSNTTQICDVNGVSKIKETCVNSNINFFYFKGEQRDGLY